MAWLGWQAWNYGTSGAFLSWGRRRPHTCASEERGRTSWELHAGDDGTVGILASRRIGRPDRNHARGLHIFVTGVQSSAKIGIFFLEELEVVCFRPISAREQGFWNGGDQCVLIARRPVLGPGGRRRETHLRSLIFA